MGRTFWRSGTLREILSPGAKSAEVSPNNARQSGDWKCFSADCLHTKVAFAPRGFLGYQKVIKRDEFFCQIGAPCEES